MLKKILSSNIIWKITGLTYLTAVIATNGSYISKSNIRQLGINDNIKLIKYLDKDKTLLEFGSGIGKNLLGISDNIKFGYGIDVNKFYCNIAEKLSKKYKINNLNFLHYDGKNLPKLNKVEIIYEKGVFKRIPKINVKEYIDNLKSQYLLPNGLMILYFLRENAKNTRFTEKLGDKAYIYWHKEEIDNIFNALDCVVLEIQEWDNAFIYISKSNS